MKVEGKMGNVPGARAFADFTETPAADRRDPVCLKPLVYAYPGFLDAATCEALIRLGRARCAASRGAGVVGSARCELPPRRVRRELRRRATRVDSPSSDSSEDAAGRAGSDSSERRPASS